MTKQKCKVLICWCVALACVIGSIALITTQPLWANTATVATVTFNGNTTPYATLKEAFDYVNTLSTTDTNRAVVQLQQDITYDGSGFVFLLYADHYAEWDLNGYLFTVAADFDEQAIFAVQGSLTITDSRPTAEHTLSNGEVVAGGTIYSPRNDDNLFFMVYGDLVINAGNYCGNGYTAIYAGGLTLNGGSMTWSNSEYNTVIIAESDAATGLTINGGYLSGQIAVQPNEGFTLVTDPAVLDKYLTLGENVKQVTENGKTVYRVETATEPDPDPDPEPEPEPQPEPVDPEPEPEPEPQPEPVDPEPEPEPTEPNATPLTVKDIIGLLLIGLALGSVVVFVVATVVEACRRPQKDTVTKSATTVAEQPVMPEQPKPSVLPQQATQPEQPLPPQQPTLKLYDYDNPYAGE